MSRRIFAVVCCAIWSLTGAQTQKPVDCYTVDDFLGCSANQFRLADTRLNQIYTKLLGRISAINGDPRTTSALKVQVVQAQRDWVKVRDGTCGAIITYNHAGSGGPSNQDFVFTLNSCKTQVTTSRSSDLIFLFDSLTPENKK